MTRTPGAGRHRSSDDHRPLNPWVEDHLWRLGGDGPVLDLGCGRGYWLRRMTGAGLWAIGVEYAADRAREAAAAGPVAVGDAAHLPFADASVGLVWCIHVLHHLPGPEQVLGEIGRVLRPGGKLVLAETVEDNPLIRAGRRFHPEWDGVAVHSRFTASSLRRLLGDCGFDEIDHRQHSLVSFAAWALPFADRLAWRGLSRLEDLLPLRLDRWGAHLECVVRRR